MRATIKILIGCLFFLASCQKNNEIVQKDDSEIRYRYYNLENQGWKSKLHSEKIDAMTFAATEVPIIYYLLKDLGDKNLFNVDSIYEKNKRERIIEFTFEGDKQDDLLKSDYTQMDYESAVKYISFTIQKDFYAVTSSKDTVKCSGVLFERNYRVLPFNKVLLFFSNINPEDNIQLVYHDNLYRKGTIKFNFTEQLLNL